MVPSAGTRSRSDSRSRSPQVVDRRHANHTDRQRLGSNDIGHLVPYGYPLAGQKG
jgi:hypothetical protein